MEKKSFVFTSLDFKALYVRVYVNHPNPVIELGPDQYRTTVEVVETGDLEITISHMKEDPEYWEVLVSKGDMKMAYEYVAKKVSPDFVDQFKRPT